MSKFPDPQEICGHPKCLRDRYVRVLRMLSYMRHVTYVGHRRQDNLREFAYGGRRDARLRQSFRNATAKKGSLWLTLTIQNSRRLSTGPATS